MPGVLKEPQDDQGSLKPGKRRLMEDMTDQPAKKVKREALTNGILAANGDHSLSNGTQTNGVQPAEQETQSATVPGLEGLFNGQLPPELEHVTENWFSVSNLITRLAQETFNELVDSINDLSEVDIASSDGPPIHSFNNAHINGKDPRSLSQANISKKEKMLNFAQDRRNQFIKILVLSQWCRQSGEMEKAVDVSYRLKTYGKAQVDNCVGWMREMTRQLNCTKVPNPDLKTALEALSLGKASWLTDLNYLPLEKIPPRELLKTLRRINTLLSVRLNIHETIPPPFRDFKIASGRATFRVKNEFELDLAVADEDPKSQFYFLDFRFLFSPVKPELPAGRLREDFESKLNDILKVEGLSGCYRFLHDFVLTHKLSILRNQAYEMLRGHWSDQIKVEAVHRSLVVQYWLRRPGGKSWIEIGIKRGKNKSSNGLDPSQNHPEVALRWFRAGKQIKETTVDLGLESLSLAGILRQVIAMHTTYIFKETTAKLREGSLYSERLLKIKHSQSATEPTSISLLVQLTKSKAIKVVQEPITGQFALLPASQPNSGAERELNTLISPAEEASARIATLRCITAREEFDSCARSASWEVVRSLSLDRETMQRFFSRDTLRIAFFRKRTWRPNWILALTTSLAGDAVWAVETNGRKPMTSSANTMGRPGSAINLAFRVSNSESRVILIDPSFTYLKQIERAAVGLISQHLDINQLLQKGISYKLEPDIATSGPMSTSLCMRLSAQKMSEILRNPSPVVIPWRNDVVLLRFAGLDAAGSSGNHVVRARMKKTIRNIKTLTATLSSSISFHQSTGEFAFRLTTPVGESTIPNLIHRLATVENLLGFLTVIEQHKLPCTIESLTRLSFDYADHPGTKATIDFPPNEPMSINFAHSSPHIRVQDSFTQMLQSPTGGLKEALTHIDTTLPLLRGFTTIEKSWASLGDGVVILPRSIEYFILRYHDPDGKVEVNLHDRKGTIMWLVKARGSHKDDTRGEGLDKSLKELGKGSGEHWRGMNGGIVATPKGVEDLIAKVDEIFRVSRQQHTVTGKSAETETTTQGLTNGTSSISKDSEQKAATPNPRKRKAENTDDDDVVVLD